MSLLSTFKLSLIFLFVFFQPLKVKGWDKALVEYIVAMLTDSASKLKTPLAKRLPDISCPGYRLSEYTNTNIRRHNHFSYMD